MSICQFLSWITDQVITTTSNVPLNFTELDATPAPNHCSSHKYNLLSFGQDPPPCFFFCSEYCSFLPAALREASHHQHGKPIVASTRTHFPLKKRREAGIFLKTMGYSVTGGSSTSSSAFSPSSDQSRSDEVFFESALNQQDPLALHKGLEAIASSLSHLTNTLGMALEEQRHYVQSKVPDRMHKEPQDSNLMKASDSLNFTRQSFEKASPGTKRSQAKVPQELAMAMTTKAKLLLRELKGVKQDLIFTKDRCSQLEEENKRLRESIDKGDRHEEDDLVRLQLEALLTEKARLAQENATFAREVQFLHEVVQYQQLKLRELTGPDESLTFDDELNFDAGDVAMELLPLYPDDTEKNNDIGESLSMASNCDPSQEYSEYV
ncbi:hypothetical protein L7F22_005592 [Adiantum nelumboides]|nr:hypothetical protein [Adiantum nelumboides]